MRFVSQKTGLVNSWDELFEVNFSLGSDNSNSLDAKTSRLY